jgi:tetratricopeptide (TPR) repeat protein
MNILRGAPWPLLCVGSLGALVIFMPAGILPLDSVKTLWIVFFVTASLLGTIAITLRDVILDREDNKISLPPRAILLSSVLVILITILSSVLSSHPFKSFLGQGFEVLTGGIIVVSILAFLLSIIHCRSEERSNQFTLGLFIVFSLLSILQIARIFWPGIDFGFLSNETSTILGKWNDLSILAGVISLASVFYVEKSSLNLYTRISAAIVLVFSTIILLITNFEVAWISLALVSASVVMYRIYKNSSTLGNISPLFIAIFIFSAFMYVKGGEIVGYKETEVTLPVQYTLSVAGDTLEKYPFLGSGPNRFLNEYLLSKPEGINKTEYWSLEFLSGSSFITTLIVTTGVLGILAWLFFIVSILRGGLSDRGEDTFSIPIFGTLTFFLWFVLFTYMPSHGILVLTFIITGIFIASLQRSGAFGQNKPLFDSHIFKLSGNDTDIARVKSTVKMIILLIVILSSILFLISYLRKTVALGYFQAGISHLLENVSNSDTNFDDASKFFEKSLTWYENDVYYQALSEVNLLAISSMVRDTEGKVDEETTKKVANLFDRAVYNTRLAVLYDKEDYYNYLSEARASELGSSLLAPGAYENAIESYRNAISKNPNDPSIYLSIARFEAGRKEYSKAKSAIGSALQIKPNYVDAIFLLVQIQIAEGKVSDALTSARVAAEISPNDPNVFFQLGLLRYNSKSYKDAITAFAQAVEISPEYANARYFLGLSYSAIGKYSDGAKHFEILAEANPNSREVADILENLKLGRPAFAGAPLSEPAPEDRLAPPLK